MVDGIEHELQRTALRADDHLVTERPLFETALHAVADEENRNRERHAERDGNRGQPRGERALSHVLRTILIKFIQGTAKVNYKSRDPRGSSDLYFDFIAISPGEPLSR